MQPREGEKIRVLELDENCVWYKHRKYIEGNVFVLTHLKTFSAVETHINDSIFKAMTGHKNEIKHSCQLYFYKYKYEFV